MNISKIIDSQVRLGYLIQVNNDSYQINKKEFRWEMFRREAETKLARVSLKKYRESLEELGVKLV